MVSVMTESKLQSLVRMECARRGWHVWRNNVGVLVDARGRPIRYGLANDSTALNAALKSADLIGWDSNGRFVSIECKSINGRVDPAQDAWRRLVERSGGYAVIVRDLSELV